MKDLMIETGKKKPDLELFASSFGYTFLILFGIAIVGGLLGIMLRKPKKSEDGSESNAEPIMVVSH
jgi:hypothetical protein